MSEQLSIMVVSAAYNGGAVRQIREELEARGHTVAEWSDESPTFFAHQRGDGAYPLTKEEEDLFHACHRHSAMADLMVVLPPVDQDAACLVGMAYTSGVPVAAYTSPKYGLMVKRCASFWFENLDGLLGVIDQWINVDNISEEEA